MAWGSLHIESDDATLTKFDRAFHAYLFALDRLLNDPDESDEANDYATAALHAAENNLMAEPASNLDELRVKADVLFFDLDSVPVQSHVEAFFADLVRLTGGYRSLAFNTAEWLELFQRRGGYWSVRDGEVYLFSDGSECAQKALAELDMRGARRAVSDLIRKTCPALSTT